MITTGTGTEHTPSTPTARRATPENGECSWCDQPSQWVIGDGESPWWDDVCCTAHAYKWFPEAMVSPSPMAVDTAVMLDDALRANDPHALSAYFTLQVGDPEERQAIRFLRTI